MLYAIYNMFFVNQKYKLYKGKGNRSRNRYPRKKRDNKKWRILIEKKYYTYGKPQCRPSNYIEKNITFPRTENRNKIINVEITNL